MKVSPFDNIRLAVFKEIYNKAYLRFPLCFSAVFKAVLIHASLISVRSLIILIKICNNPYQHHN